MKCAALLLVLLLTTPALAASRHSPAPRRAVSPAQQSAAQVDGILSGVVDALWAQNDHYFHEGDYPRIIGLDRIIVQADPHFIDCYTTGAWLMWSDGLDADADAFYRQCVQNNPRTSAAYYDYGAFLFHHLRRYDDARRVFQASAALPDAGVIDWRMLAHSYEKLGQYDRAALVWRRIKARWPNGAPGDETHGAVDTNNLNKNLTKLAPSPPSPARPNAPLKVPAR